MQSVDMSQELRWLRGRTSRAATLYINWGLPIALVGCLVALAVHLTVASLLARAGQLSLLQAWFYAGSDIHIAGNYSGALVLAREQLYPCITYATGVIILPIAWVQAVKTRQRQTRLLEYIESTQAAQETEA